MIPQPPVKNLCALGGVDRQRCEGYAEPIAQRKLIFGDDAKLYSRLIRAKKQEKSRRWSVGRRSAAMVNLAAEATFG
jgi:hypothetical protein